MSDKTTKKSRFSASSFFLGLLFGAAAGAAAGLLLAPASGDTTRATLQTKMKKSQGQAQASVDQVKDWSEENKTGFAAKIQLVKQALNAGKEAAAKKHEQLTSIENTAQQENT